MSPTSFLSAADVAGLTAVNFDGFETLAAEYPDLMVDVVFARASGETWVYTPPQRVRVEYADRQERQTRSDAGELVTIDGWLISTAPLDVKRGDLFSIGATGNEERAEVIAVRPAELGLQRAAFRLRLGEA